MIKIKLNIRDDVFYPYSISIMGQEQVLLKEKELIALYSQIKDIMMREDK